METGAWRAWDQLSPTIPHHLSTTWHPVTPAKLEVPGQSATILAGSWVTALGTPRSFSLGGEMVCDTGVRVGRGSGREGQTPPCPGTREATKIKLWTIF